MKKKFISVTVAFVIVFVTIISFMTASQAEEQVIMTPMHGEPFQPPEVTFGRVSFLVPSGTKGLTKDAWDDNIDHNTDLILLTFEKNGTVYIDKTIKEIKNQFGNLALVRTCYTYDEIAGNIRMNLVFHFDDYDKLTPSDIISVTIKPGFVWCAGSPSGISEEVTSLRLDTEVTFFTKGTAGITAIKSGIAAVDATVLNFKFNRNDNESLKAISAVNLCPSAIPGKTLGDLITIGGVTVTELVNQGKVARFNFYGETLVFHIDDGEYMKKVKTEQLEFVILPGFQWMNWYEDDWGNWDGTHKDDYTPVKGALVKTPIAFHINEKGEVCVKTDGITVEPGYKSTYYVGDRIDMKSLLIKVNYSSGRSEVMPILESMVKYDFSKAGTATVSLDVNGMKASYTVTVLDNSETESITEEITETESLSETETEEITETESLEESTTDEESVTEEQTTVESIGSVTEVTDEDNAGCKSSVALISIACVVLSAGAVIYKKKEL